MKNQYVCHSGVKGMKWGVRKKNARNENYTDKQRAYDRKIYGRRAEKRINKRMNAGEGVKSARHNEAVRRQRKVNTKGLGRAALRSSEVQKLIPIGAGLLVSAGLLGARSVAKKTGHTNNAFVRNSDKIVANIKRVMSSDTSSFGGASNLATDFLKTILK